ncbi:MAG: DUF2839 domain-containing protein [Acaryochloris sp. RU_4_1]|nr:DUF2839 domain-containing protein [Acaryochloris sp. SU_5_25]NJM67899.1 DUF2839 domain-containing protein [Acaryochloris sp. RU_4_1]NJR54783.1 DUF2839 domain-containing protein [Acaryochloris sp. CRU_2_0]
MGEAKRRKETLGEDYGKEPNLLPWLPVTQQQLQKVYKVVMRGSWVAVFVVLLSWIILRFIGPSFGWWELVSTGNP